MNSGVNDLLNQSDHIHVHLCEAGLLLLAALGAETKFPDNASGLKALVSRVAEGRPGRPTDFAIDAPEEVPLHTDKSLTWISPAPDGCVRLRREREAVILQPDGRLEEFESTTGSRVSGSESIRAEEVNPDIQEAQSRFRTQKLLCVRSAAPPVDNAPFVSFVALYRTGVVVYYLVPRPSDVEVASASLEREPLIEAIELPLILSDSLETTYEEVDLSVLDLSSKLLRASRSFVPAVPEEAELLSVRFDSRSIEIQTGPP
jgi:hypothetical protein